MRVDEVFKLFENHVIKTSKKENIDYINEVYSLTELFDITNVDMKENLQLPKDFILPFESCFVKITDISFEDYSVFVKEYSPTYIVGSFFHVITLKDITFELNLPFSIDLERMKIRFESEDILSFEEGLKNIVVYLCSTKLDKEKEQLFYRLFPIDKLDITADKFKKYFLQNITYLWNEYGKIKIDAIIDTFKNYIYFTVHTLNNLNGYSCLTDITKKPEFYKFKNKSTKKISSRVIYYYMNKEKHTNKTYRIKPITKLEYSHSFRVRGHWRKLSENSIGKNRNGNYSVKGYTWVIDFIKGKGELKKKIRIVK